MTIIGTIQEIDALKHTCDGRCADGEWCIFKEYADYGVCPIDKDGLCLEIETELEPKELLKYCLETEQRLHRVRDIRWGPRTLDVDILLYGNKVIEEDDLEVPSQRTTGISMKRPVSAAHAKGVRFDLNKGR